MTDEAAIQAEIASMTAVILAGGLGTRLREETEFKPKPMVRIGTQPILWHIMRLYRKFGVKRFIVCLGYRGDVIRDYFLRHRLEQSDFEIDLASGDIDILSPNLSDDWKVVLAETGAATSTGGRVLRALPYVKGERFFLTYGDGLCDVDISEVYRYHRTSGKLATVTAVHPTARFGELDINDGVAEKFLEKPQIRQGWINGGFFVLERAALDGFSGDETNLENDVLETLSSRQQLAAFQHDGFWQCMDTFRETQMLNEMWTKGEAPWA
jgi:glucose-1-phosphate cytidylyltransferase